MVKGDIAVHVTHHRAKGPPATQRKFTRPHPTLTPAKEADTQFTYPRGMESWVDGYIQD